MAHAGTPTTSHVPQEADLNRYCSCRKTQRATQAKASLSALLDLGNPTSTAELNERGEQPLLLQVMEQSAAVCHENQDHLFPVMHPGYTCPSPCMNVLYTPQPCRMQTTPNMAQDLRQSRQDWTKPQDQAPSASGRSVPTWAGRIGRAQEAHFGANTLEG